jgi:predicted alpha/beta superfamily hydrolase
MTANSRKDRKIRMDYTRSFIGLSRLQRSARLYVGIPENVKQGERFPVLYMNDGQNVFADKDAFNGISWGLVSSYRNTPDLPRIIVVGLECAEGSRRFDEYSGFFIDHPGLEVFEPKPTGMKGDIYLETIISEIKPMIDSIYPTLPDPEHTGIIGSSMGGIISCYAALTREDVFSRFGSLSGAFFVSELAFMRKIEQTSMAHVRRFYLSVGTNEFGVGDREEYLRVNRTIFDTLSRKIPPERLQFKIVEGGIHHESAWATLLPSVIRFLFSDIGTSFQLT